jgi:glycerol uptake facilitator-like aquaporin
MKKYFSESLATFFLLTIVVGSGIMGERLSPDNAAVALLANAAATGAGLVFFDFNVRRNFRRANESYRQFN